MSKQPIFDLPNRSEEYLEKVQTTKLQFILIGAVIFLIFFIAFGSLFLAYFKGYIEQNLKINEIILNSIIPLLTAVVGYYFRGSVEELKSKGIKAKDITKKDEPSQPNNKDYF